MEGIVKWRGLKSQGPLYITTKTSSPFKDDHLLISGYNQWGILIDLTFSHWTSVLIGILPPTAILNFCVLLPKAGAIPIGHCLTSR